MRERSTIEKRIYKQVWFMQLQRCTDRIMQLGPRNHGCQFLRIRGFLTSQGAMSLAVTCSLLR